MALIETAINLNGFFSNQINKIPIGQPATKAYIDGILAKPAKDLSNKSLTIIYSQAKFEYRFDLFQQLADYILFSKIVFPESLNAADQTYYNALAQNSYYTCYRLINKQWVLFEELADMFPAIVSQTRKSISNLLPQL